MWKKEATINLPKSERLGYKPPIPGTIDNHADREISVISKRELRNMATEYLNNQIRKEMLKGNTGLETWWRIPSCIKDKLIKKGYEVIEQDGYSVISWSKLLEEER